MEIGKKIKSIRKGKDWSQDAIAESAGLSQSTIASIENGKMKPSEKTVRGLSSALEVTYDELINGTDWKAEYKENFKTSYAIDPFHGDVSINNDGSWEFKNHYYPRVDSNNQENNFSPLSGEKLVFECKKCKRKIYKPENKYCMGCGENILPKYTLMSEIKHIMITFPFFKDENAAYECARSLIQVSDQIDEISFEIDTSNNIPYKKLKELGLYTKSSQTEKKYIQMNLSFNKNIVEKLAKNMLRFQNQHSIETTNNNNKRSTK